MAKPIDETWTARNQRIFRDGDEDEIARFDVSFRNEDDAGRAKLAAESPRMARMLRDNAYRAPGASLLICIACGEDSLQPHADGCEWLGIMRRLGERP